MQNGPYAPDVPVRVTASTSSLLNPQAPQRAPFAAPRTWLELEVASFWEELFAVGPLGRDDEFFALGGDSLLALRMLDGLRARLGVTLSLEVLVHGATIQRVATALARARARTEALPSPTLVRFRPGRDRPPLVCIHPAGGAVLCYLELARRLPPSLPVYGIEEPSALHGVDVSVEERAAAYLQCLDEQLPNRTWHLAGHSFGGLVAFEIARQLSVAGHRAGLVALIDTQPPGHGETGSEDESVRRLGEILEDSPLDSDDSVDPAADRRMWSALAEFATGVLVSRPGERPARWGAIERFCRDHRFLPSGTSMGYLEARRFLRAMRAAFRSARRYAPGHYSGRVLLCLGAGSATGESDGRVAVRNQLARTRWSAIAPRLATCAIPGHHFDVLGAPHVDTLAAAIDTALLE